MSSATSQQILESKRLVVQGIPAVLDQPVEPTFSSRLLTQFNADPTPIATIPAATTTVVTTHYTDVDYEVYYLPDEVSIFLIKFGSEADDLADRYNALLTYTKGLLRTIEKTNQVSVLPVAP